MSLKSSVGGPCCHQGLGTTEGKRSLSPCWMYMAEFRQRESKCDKMCQWAMGAEEAFQRGKPCASPQPLSSHCLPRTLETGSRERRSWLCTKPELMKYTLCQWSLWTVWSTNGCDLTQLYSTLMVVEGATSVLLLCVGVFS